MLPCQVTGAYLLLIIISHDHLEMKTWVRFCCLIVHTRTSPNSCIPFHLVFSQNFVPQLDANGRKELMPHMSTPQGSTGTVSAVLLKTQNE